MIIRGLSVNSSLEAKMKIHIGKDTDVLHLDDLVVSIQDTGMCCIISMLCLKIRFSVREV